jgi:hypothetical protein
MFLTVTVNIRERPDVMFIKTFYTAMTLVMIFTLQ